MMRMENYGLRMRVVGSMEKNIEAFKLMNACLSLVAALKKSQE